MEIHWRKHYNHIVFTLAYINKSYRLIHLQINPMDPVKRSISMKYLPWQLTQTLCLSIFGSAQGLEERQHTILLSSSRWWENLAMKTQSFWKGDWFSGPLGRGSYIISTGKQGLGVPFESHDRLWHRNLLLPCVIVIPQCKLPKEILFSLFNKDSLLLYQQSMTNYKYRHWKMAKAHLLKIS